MKFRLHLKSWLNRHPSLYRLYTKIRYQEKTKVRDWVLECRHFMRNNALNTFVFEEDATYVRINSGYEFQYVPEEMGGLLGLEFQSGFEADDIHSVLELIPRNPIVLDIGANFGFYSIQIAGASSAAHVHAFEPVGKTMLLLQSNALRNGVADRITINNVAVGQDVNRLMITADRYAGNYLLTDSDYDGTVEEVPVIRLDDYVVDKNLNRIDFIKCDVEGAELMVMKGSKNILEQFRPIVMLEIAEEWTRRFGYSASDLMTYMAKCGYEYRHASEVAKQFKSDTAISKTHNYFFFPKK